MIPVLLLDDVYTMTFASRDAAYSELLTLKPDLPEDKRPIFRENADKFLSDNGDSSVLWWHV